MKEAVIVAGARTPVGKAKRGALAHVRPDELGAIALRETLHRAQLAPADIDDVIIGCAMPEAEQGMNMARTIAVLAGLPHEVPAITINRYCSSGLQSIAYAADQIRLGTAKAIIAGGAESMSLIPMGGHVIAPHAALVEEQPEYYMGMGYTAEEVARRFGVGRTEQDEFAAESHRRAAKAINGGKFVSEIVSVPVTRHFVTEDHQASEETHLFSIDEGVRPDTTIERLAELRPAFHLNGTVTAGNTSQMSDGAATVLVMEKEEALQRGLKPLAKVRSYAVAGVAPEIMGIGPVEAIPKALALAGLKIEDIGLIELNEAFAAQAVEVMRKLKLDPERVNVNGGAIALGHPLGCTGTKLTLTLIHEMNKRNEQFGLVTMCIGGGMGAAAVFELV